MTIWLLNARLQRHSGQFATNPEYLFFTQFIIEEKKCLTAVTLPLRKLMILSWYHHIIIVISRYIVIWKNMKTSFFFFLTAHIQNENAQIIFICQWRFVITVMGRLWIFCSSSTATNLIVIFLSRANKNSGFDWSYFNKLGYCWWIT